MKIAYIEKRFNRSTMAIIVAANSIMDDYERRGFKLTLRQIYYQFIARDLFPAEWIDAEYNAKHHLHPDTKNTLKNYKRLGDILNNGRLAGLIDWDAIEDRTRSLSGLNHWEKPNDIIRAVAQQFRVDKWAEQKYRPEVWIEKEALAGVVERICGTLDIPYLSCRGYTSQSEMQGGAMRLKRTINNGQIPLILHFGDHDPSGIDMTRDIFDRLTMFGVGNDIDFRRMALSMAQVKTYKCPPNPAKETDCRFKDYEKKYGNQSWELDALEPEAIEKLISDEVLSVRHQGEWDKAVAYENRCREELQFAAENWKLVTHAFDKRSFRKAKRRRAK